MSTIVVTRDEAVATLTLNRPDALNAFTLEMAEALRDAIRTVLDDATVRAVVVTGAGRAFCAGGDIRYMHGLVSDARWDDARALAAVGIDVVQAIARTPKPVVAALNGAAAGGGAGLALACDVRLASENASIGLTFSTIGLHTDWGSTYALPRLVGLGKALELAMGGEMVSAAEACRLGLVNQVVPSDQVMPVAQALAARLAAKPGEAVGRIKASIRASLATSLDEVLAGEVENQARLFTAPEVRAALAAFVNRKRTGATS